MRRIITLAWIIFALCACEKASYLETTGSLSEEEEGALEEADTGICYVQVSGAVHHPGVYELPEGARVYQVLELAGGLREDASDELNQAARIEDGQRILVRTQAEAALDAEQEADDGRININTADAAQLMTLPGIGEAKAQAILSYREEHGPFGSVEDMMNITGIKEGVFSRIRDAITVGN